MSLERLRKIDSRSVEFCHLLRTIVARTQLVEPRTEVRVFGSYASGEFTAESDIDLAFVVPDHWSRRDFYRALFAEGPLSPWPLDIVIIPFTWYQERKSFGGVAAEIAESGIELYPNWRLI